MAMPAVVTNWRERAGFGWNWDSKVGQPDNESGNNEPNIALFWMK
jgi:hypothetical protein